ncbi:hypothetical protein ACFL4W_04950, partial [Planctomycetota bacterium]
YGTYLNPIKKIIVTNEDLGLLKVCGLKDGKEIIGLPYKFVENLVFILGVDGKNHVVALPEIRAIVNYRGTAEFECDHQAVRIMVSDYVEKAFEPADEKGVELRPIRILSEKIKMQEFFETYEEGYRQLVNLQLRMRLYSRPFLYPRRTRMGLTYFDFFGTHVYDSEDRERVEFLGSMRSIVPLYWQWSTGEDFKFQSVNSIGGRPSPYLPFLEPVFSFESELKSHFFHAYFEGTLRGNVAGGSSVMGGYPMPNHNTGVVPDFNHMILMGGDYRQWSFSVGTYYNIMGLVANGEPREVLASKSSPIVRIMHTTDKGKFKFLYSWSDYEASSASQVKDRLEGENLLLASIQSFDYDSYYIRAGYEFDFTEELKVGIDVLYLTGTYKEKQVAQDNDMDFGHVETGFYFTHAFSYYISVTFRYNHRVCMYDYDFLGSTDNRRYVERMTGVAVEFLF